jgi:hypothetical protein
MAGAHSVSPFRRLQAGTALLDKVGVAFERMSIEGGHHQSIPTSSVLSAGHPLRGSRNRSRFPGATPNAPRRWHAWVPFEVRGERHANTLPARRFIALSRRFAGGPALAEGGPLARIFRAILRNEVA